MKLPAPSALRLAGLDAGYHHLLRPALFRLGKGDPEVAHERTIQALSHVRHGGLAAHALRTVVGAPDDPTMVAGLRFPGRIGLAAGVDKDGLAAAAWSSLGLGFAELGTVTALPQPGNDKPRMYRLRASEAVINRMGFNNRGAEAMAAHLRSLGVKRGRRTLGIPLGISIGKSKVTALDAAVGDYLTSLEALAPYADYVAINVSSPNTPGLRELQHPDFLRELTGTLVRRADELTRGSAAGPLPIFVKVAPDLDDAGLDDVLTVCHETGIRGLIVCNTTLSREGLAPADQHLADQAGGLSGAPLTVRARGMVATVAGRTTLPVIASGGIMTPDDAMAAFDAGARLVQVYTGFIYHGAALVTGANERSRAHRTQAAR